MNSAVRVSHLKKSYPMGGGLLPVLRGVSFEVAKGELVAVVGESGSGKSTLLHLLGALDTPTSGEVEVGGINPFRGSDAAVSHFRNRHIGFVFQHNNLLPEFTCLENVMMPGLIAGGSEKALRAKAAMLLESVGLTHRVTHFPGMMSGGEQQRTAIARALINDPVLLLADEPSGNLDSQNALKVHALFGELNARLKTTILVVTHNVEFAHALPRRLEMRDGEIIGDVKTG
ncbi:MAG: ABC transporter ATP-binding protein [Silvanigrellales bacterium]|jgi:lipoprotein-releasing system ATP-binding protein|nr:ABC transporter ATP-binding protein [Silvanigrellales bacterium]